MELEELIKGILVGLGASIPLGPIGVLVVQRTISKGRQSGFISGLGAATADTIFAALAVLSLAFVQRIFNANENWFLIGGGLLVAGIGLTVYLSNPVKQLRRKKQASRSFEDYISVFILTISNPGATFLMLALFALVGVNIDKESGVLNIAIVLWGVVLGSAAWWFFLSWLINRFRHRFRIRQLWYINRIAGIIIIILGIISLFDGLAMLLFNIGIGN
jgi:threonine/homoserine/homoserine lactone efflux protein